MKRVAAGSFRERFEVTRVWFPEKGLVSVSEIITFRSGENQLSWETTISLSLPMTPGEMVRVTLRPLSDRPSTVL